jgi:hypothetical protein
MADARRALIVATDQYGDPKLTPLAAPAEDARALAEVLRDPDVGAYEVETVLNKTCQEVEIAIAGFFASGARGDTLLVHFSCHGVKDLSGELYFATTDTRLPLLKVTAVSSSMVKTAMEESRASLILCLVDCCYSGAFTKSTKAAATVDLTERLGGRGRAVITASTSLQLALDGKEEPSLFTHAVVEGLRSGEADKDLDGLVTLDEFYDYVHEMVTQTNPDQTPLKSFDVEGEVYVARRGGPISTPAPLPRELADTLATGEDWQRMGAVSRLSDLLSAGHPGRALGARLELERVRDNDDSLRVRAAAGAALEAAGEAAPMPTIPLYTEKAPSRPRPQAEPAPLPEPEEATATRSAAPDTSAPDTSAPAGTGVVQHTAPAAAGAAATAYGLESGGAGQPPGGAVQPAPRELDDRGDGGGRRGPGRGMVITAALAAATIVVGLVVWAVVHNTRDDPATPPGALTLPDSELLVPIQKNGARVLEAVDVDTGAHRDLIGDADLPALSSDRSWMTFIRDVPTADPSDDDLINRVAFAAEVAPPRHVNPLLQDNARELCPTSSRPAMSLDGGFVALVCRDASPDGKSGSPLGLWHASVTSDGVDGNEMVPSTQDSAVIDSPSWTGSKELIYVVDGMGPEGQSTLWIAPTSEGAAPEELTDGTGWDSHPDWSGSGVLFLRRPAHDIKTGDVWLLEDAGPRQLTEGVDALWPTWSPDGKRIAYLVSEGDAVRSLWVLDTSDPDAQPREVELDGNPGPPAWSER